VSLGFMAFAFCALTFAVGQGGPSASGTPQNREPALACTALVGVAAAHGWTSCLQHRGPPPSGFGADPNNRVQSHLTESSTAHGTTRKTAKSKSV
jgi:hypothetical protein